MIKFFNRAFKITNENIILTTPLVLFWILISFYMWFAQAAPKNLASGILLFVTIIFMFAAFFAGWFFMVKKAVDLDKQDFIIDEDKAKASFNLIKEIPSGIGEYFFTFLGGLILYAGLFALMFFIAYQIGVHAIGKADLVVNQLKIAMSSPMAIKTLVSSMSKEDLLKLNEWNFLFLATTAIFSFITMFWPAQVIFKNKNPLIAFFKSIAFELKNFLSSIILFVYICAINFLVSFAVNFLAVFQMKFAFLAWLLLLLSLLIYFYSLVYVVVLVFLYYDSNCYKKTEEETKNNSNSGPDGDGQEQSGDSQS